MIFIDGLIINDNDNSIIMSAGNYPDRSMGLFIGKFCYAEQGGWDAVASENGKKGSVTEWKSPSSLGVSELPQNRCRGTKRTMSEHPKLMNIQVNLNFLIMPLVGLLLLTSATLACLCLIVVGVAYSAVKRGRSLLFVPIYLILLVLLFL